MVHDADQPGDVVGHRDAFVLGLVRQHRAGDDIADRPDAVDLGAEIVVGLDLAARVGLEADRGEVRALRCSGRRPIDDEHAVGVERFRCAAGGGLERQRGLPAR